MADHPIKDLPPWKRAKPGGKSSAKLTPYQLEAARQRAEQAGRRYPNLVDNMWAKRHVAPAAPQFHSDLPLKD